MNSCWILVLPPAPCANDHKIKKFQDFGTVGQEAQNAYIHVQIEKNKINTIEAFSFLWRIDVYV